MSEFSVGDRVRIKTWEELLQECENDEDFYISYDRQSIFSYKGLPGFVEEMRELCGKTATIIDITRTMLPGMTDTRMAYTFDRIYLEFDSYVKHHWHYGAYMMVPIDDMEFSDFPSVIDFYN